MEAHAKVAKLRTKISEHMIHKQGTVAASPLFSNQEAHDALCSCESVQSNPVVMAIVHKIAAGLGIDDLDALLEQVGVSTDTCTSTYGVGNYECKTNPETGTAVPPDGAETCACSAILNFGPNLCNNPPGYICYGTVDAGSGDSSSGSGA
jgi:hypothetical protein